MVDSGEDSTNALRELHGAGSTYNVLSSHLSRTSDLWTHQPESHRKKITQEEGHTGGRSHRISLPSFCRACFNFSRKRIQPSLYLVGRKVECCVPVNCWA